MRPVLLLLALLLAVTAAPAAARPSAAARQAERVRAYEEARDDAVALRTDAKRRELRHHWLRITDRLDRMAARADHPRRCEALFVAGRAYAELSERSYLEADRRGAVDRFRRLARACPESNLADDALLRAATLLAPRDPGAARFELERLLARHAKSDMAGEARTLLRTLPASRKAEAKAASKPLAARAEAHPAPAPASSPAPAPAKPADPARPAFVETEPAVARIDLEVAAAGPAARPAEAPASDGPAPLDGERVDGLADLERRAPSDLSLSMIAGLKVRRVVIDPGHGGKDVGAVGKGGLHEADVTLAIAKKLRKRLQAQGLEVLLTREDDRTVPLEARTAFANEHKADLFVSVHVNAAASRKLRGIETYTLNLNSDRYAMRLAARENASSERTIGDLQLILADLATKANTDDSVRLAGRVQGELVGRLRRSWPDVKDLGTKQALFFVLLGAKMPAILVEASFVSNPDEEKRLRSDAYREEIARGIAEGLRRFVDEREALARGPGSVF